SSRPRSVCSSTRRPCRSIGPAAVSDEFSADFLAECDERKQSTKTQTPSTKESSNLNIQNLPPSAFGLWKLEFSWGLEIGIWDFKLMIQLSKNYSLPQR